MADIRLVNGEDVRDLRISIFADEQGYPEEKLFDEHEATADFLALIDEGRTVGCGRFYKEDETAFHIDNIAFSKDVRGKGLGKKLVLALIGECKKNGAEKVTVNAQSYAVGF